MMTVISTVTDSPQMSFQLFSDVRQNDCKCGVMNVVMAPSAKRKWPSDVALNVDEYRNGIKEPSLIYHP
jgi:hypothetical protein